MTRQRTFKQLVRARMATTGERYAAARAVLLGSLTAPTRHEVKGPGHLDPVLATAEATIRARTGRGWEEWFDALDDWGAQDRSHREIARWVAEELDVAPLAWAAQSVTVSYERARKARAVGEHPDGYTATASKTVAAPVDQLFAAFCAPSSSPPWAPDVTLRTRSATAGKAAHFNVEGSHSRVHVHFEARGDARSRISIQHARLANAAEADRYKTVWRNALADLADSLTDSPAHSADPVDSADVADSGADSSVGGGHRA